MCIYGHLRGAEVRCTITLKNKKRLYLYLPVSSENESYKRFDARIRKLENLLCYNTRKSRVYNVWY